MTCCISTAAGVWQLDLQAKDSREQLRELSEGTPEAVCASTDCSSATQNPMAAWQHTKTCEGTAQRPTQHQTLPETGTQQLVDCQAREGEGCRGWAYLSSTPSLEG